MSDQSPPPYSQATQHGPSKQNNSNVYSPPAGSSSAYPPPPPVSANAPTKPSPPVNNYYGPQGPPMAAPYAWPGAPGGLHIFANVDEGNGQRRQHFMAVSSVPYGVVPPPRAMQPAYMGPPTSTPYQPYPPPQPIYIEVPAERRESDALCACLAAMGLSLCLCLTCGMF
ncbi:hypothetical protein, no similarity [Geotrichum candidum]|uniref:Cysteine-rich transmembrane CYSTM domain-containing protein n=1 Tax=Geotrichum candidum TaxID=1173061 RepID=A0A0J9X9K2_GEOCN|nr:hypothetical protein, no similarity [Geotrichum candidum]